MFGGYKAAMVQTKMGERCRNQVEKALRLFPKAKLIIGVGVAYGADAKKQKLGDVLISEFIDAAGNVKYTKDGDIIFRPGEERFTPISECIRNVFCLEADTWKFNCSVNIIVNESQAVNAKRNTYRECDKHIGLIISHSALVDNENIKVKFVENVREFIGGEMEGQVLASIQHDYATRGDNSRRHFDIVIIKGVADYGNGLKAKNWQYTAAVAAANFTAHMLGREEDLFQCGKNFVVRALPIAMAMVYLLWFVLLHSICVTPYKYYTMDTICMHVRKFECILQVFLIFHTVGR